MIIFYGYRENFIKLYIFFFNSEYPLTVLVWHERYCIERATLLYGS